MTHLTYGGCYAAFYGTGPPLQVPFISRIALSFDLAGELRVLDLGCGTGRLLAPLAELGWRVVGMDPQFENLAEARKMADLAAGRIEIVAGGFAELDETEAFDIVVAVGDPWWYLLTPEARADALYRVHRALRPGGAVVLDGPNFEWILDHYRHPEPSEALVDGSLVRKVPVHDIDRVGGTWSQTDTFSMADTGEELTMVHRFAIIPLEEVLSSIRDVGFDCVACYSSWASNAPDGPEGPRVIAVGRRSPIGT
jgi:SAM-dependent methyltransferase